MKCVYGWAGRRAGVRYVITKFSRMDSLPNFLTHGPPLRARFARARSSAIRKLKSFFSWVKIAMGKNGGSSEQTKPFAVSFCAGSKYLAIGHCRFTTSFWLCLFEDRKYQMYLSNMFYEKVRQDCTNNFVRTTLLSKNIVYKNNT